LSGRSDQNQNNGAASAKVILAVGSSIVIFLAGVAAYLASRATSFEAANQALAVVQTDLQELEARIAALESRPSLRSGDDLRRSDPSSIDASLMEQRRQQQELAKRRAQLAKALAQAKQELAFSPEMQQLRFQHFKESLGLRFGPLYRDFQFSPEQIAAFEEVMAERFWSISGLTATRLNQSMGDVDFAELQSQMLGPLDRKLQSVLGDAAYQQYQQSEGTGSVRGLVGTIAGSIAQSSESPTASQLRQMAEVLAANTWMPGSDHAGPLGGGWIEAEVVGDYAPKRTAEWKDVAWDDAMQRLRTILSPGQVSVVEKLREQMELRKDAETLKDAVLLEVRKQSGLTPSKPAEITIRER